MTKSELTQQTLRTFLDYDKETGVFTWRVQRGRSTQVGTVAGYLVKGYVKIKLFGKIYFAHRLAWLYVNGVWPDDQIDHINCVRDDNRFCNLREATGSLNLQNQRRPNNDNSSGYLGVARNRGKWRARIGLNGTNINLGIFTTPEAAHEAYVSAKRELHEGCTL
jgi:hypothetical protein